jgi:polysaccharide deacetylase
MSEKAQENSLYRANEKMQKLFGNRSDIFIPPHDSFNNSTLKAMKQVGLKLLSSAAYEERNVDQNRSVFTVTNGKIFKKTWR